MWRFDTLIDTAIRAKYFEYLQTYKIALQHLDQDNDFNSTNSMAVIVLMKF